jgi:hypothetical protein
MATAGIDEHLISPDDPRIETVGGMKRYHAGRLCWFCQGVYKGKPLLMIVRGSNPASLQFQGRANHFPKSADVNSPSGERGRVKIDGAQFYSDYDLMGVYEKRDEAYYRLYIANTAHIKAIEPDHRTATQKAVMENVTSLPNTNPFLQLLNSSVEPRNPVGDERACLFQHGSNDDYMLAGRMKNDSDKIGDVFLAFCPDGKAYLLPDQSALRAFYERYRISYNYS